MTRDNATASQIMSALSDWAAGDGTPTDGAQPYPDVIRAVFEGMAWLGDAQPGDAMVSRGSIQTLAPVGPDVRVQVAFSTEPDTDGLFPVSVTFRRGDGTTPVPRITDQVAARLVASLTLVCPTAQRVRLPFAAFLPGACTDRVDCTTDLRLGLDLAAAYRRLVETDTTPGLSFEQRSYRGRPDDVGVADAGIRRLHIPNGWTVEPSLHWIRQGDPR